MTEPAVQLESVHKRFGRCEVLKGISLDVRPREVLCLLGPSGSGKSTLLRCINHLEKIDAGRVWVDGELVGYRQAGDTLHELREREVARKRAEIGMVFQRFNLFPHLTALDNVAQAPTCACAACAARTLARADASCCAASGWPTSSTATHASSRVASSSAWRSRVPWRWSPSSCSSTSRRRRWTPSSWAMSSTSCGASRTAA
jgi:polar amino acid transport system ATP-binding protein